MSIHSSRLGQRTTAIGRKLPSIARRAGRQLLGAQFDQGYDGFGSKAVGQAAWQRSFKRPGGSEDVQTLPTAVDSP